MQKKGIWNSITEKNLGFVEEQSQKDLCCW